MALKDDDPLLDKFIELDCDLRQARRERQSSCGGSMFDEVLSLTSRGVDFSTADRAVWLANNHPHFSRMSPEEIISRNL